MFKVLNIRVVSLCFLFLLVVGCAVDISSGSTFKHLQKNVYTIKLYYAPDSKPAVKITHENKAVDTSMIHTKAMEFIEKNSIYSEYTILKIEDNFMPPYYKYTILFK